MSGMTVWKMDSELRVRIKPFSVISHSDHAKSHGPYDEHELPVLSKVADLMTCS